MKIPKSLTKTQLLESGKIPLTAYGQCDAHSICSYLNQKYRNKNSIVVSALADFDIGTAGSNQDLGFVLGLAILGNGCGCMSTYRMSPECTGEKFESEEDEYNALLLRTCKIMVHEIGHMFGLKHCTFYECGMNGTISVDETDSKPIQFCPVCYRKIASCLKFDPIKRYKALTKVCS